MFALVVSRARAHPAPLLAVAVNVLVVCTLVAGIGASLPLVQQASLQSRLDEIPAQDAVVTFVSTYDAEDADADDRAVREELAGVTEVAGGDVVRRLDSGSYAQVARGRPTWTFTALSGAEERLEWEAGRAPAASGDVLEVAAPAGSDAVVGDEITLRSLADDRTVDAVVVGSWSTRAESELWFGTVDDLTLLLPADDFGTVAGAGSSARWRAVPALADLEAGQLDDLAEAVTAATTSGADRASEGVSGSVRAETTDLAGALADRARELVVLRALLLVPAALLLLLGGACLFLVASALADARTDEASLLRSRGAGPRQLFAPTVLESAAICGAATAVSPLLAGVAIRLGDRTPPLTPAAWLAAAVAAAVCLLALVLPVVLRALTGDRGEQLSAERQRRRRLTGLVAAVLLVSVLGALAVLQLRGFGSVVTSGTGSATVDPFLVTSPALLLLALAVLVALLVLPVLLRLLTAVGSRGVALPLGSRFAARATSRTVPLALVVILASGTLAFAATQRLSSADAREVRAEFEVGTDVRVLPPADVLRAGTDEERRFLDALPGVTAVDPVHRDQTFVEDLPAGVLVVPVAGSGDVDALPSGALTTAERERLLVRPWQDPDLGIPLPRGAEAIRLEITAEALRLEEVEFLVAGPDGNVMSLVARARARGGSARLDVSGRLEPGSRLVAVRTVPADARVPGRVPPDRRGDVPAAVTVDGDAIAETGRWWSLPGQTGQTQVVTFGGRPSLPAALPVAISADLAAQASLEVGDVVALDVLGFPADLEVAAVVPYVRTTSASDGNGLLLDAASVLPTLVLTGFSDAPDEWWLRVADGRTGEVAAAIASHPEIAESVVTDADVSRRLDDDPSTGGAALGELLVLTSGGGLVVGSLLLLSVVLLRRREHSTQDRTLVTVGARRRDLLGVLGTEYALTTGAGMLFGVLLGVVVARVTLVSMTLGPDGQLLVPAPELTLPGPASLLPLGAMALVPLLVTVLLTRVDQARERTEPGRGGR